jgi:hypothetical protein
LSVYVEYNRDVFDIKTARDRHSTVNVFRTAEDDSLQPDIILHQFGHHRNNLLAIEVTDSGSVVAASAIRDTRKLIALAFFEFPRRFD